MGTTIARPACDLTPAEVETLKDLAQGLSMREAAMAHRVSPETVKKHRRHVLYKLGAHNAPHAVSIAYRRGILPAALLS